jgi:uncharacterized protein with HEPN domain
MSRAPVDRLHDIVHSAHLAIRHARASATGSADADAFRDAALFRIAIVCEAASHLPPEVQALASEIPWPEIRGMRNYIVHSYWQIDFSIVVDTIERDLAPLLAAVERLLPLAGRSES